MTDTNQTLPAHWHFDDEVQRWLWEPSGDDVRYWISVKASRTGSVWFELSQARRATWVYTQHPSLKAALSTAEALHRQRSPEVGQAVF